MEWPSEMIIFLELCIKEVWHSCTHCECQLLWLITLWFKSLCAMCLPPCWSSKDLKKPWSPKNTAGQPLIPIHDPVSSFFTPASCPALCSADRLLSPRLSGQGSEDAVLGQWCQGRTGIAVLGGRPVGHRESIYELNSTRWLLLMQLKAATVTEQGTLQGNPLQGQKCSH